jgi:DNA polymerase-3 subunit gamma/tau
MLTEPAFNALLKTLEEPPPHAIFVLATTEVHKVPLTILSRCQRFDFRRIPQAVIVSKLQQICDQEGITVEPTALALVSKAATGSLRDAENLLEQLILHYGTNLSDEHIRSELGMSEDERVHKLAKYVLDGDVPAGLETINSMAADAIDLRQASRSLVEYLRKLLLIKAGAIGTADPPEEIAGEMKALVANRSLEDLSKAIKLFAQIDFRTDPQATLPLELALIDFSLSASPKPSEGPNEIIGSSISKKKDKDIISESELSLALPKSDQHEDTVELPIEASTFIESIDETASPESPHNVEYIRQHWNDFINACRGMGSSGHLDALLRNSCQVADLEGNTLVLDFRHEWHKSKIEDPKYRHQVEVKLQEVFKYPYQVRCTLTTKNRETDRSQKASNPVVEAAIEMGARIVGEEHENDE